MDIQLFGNKMSVGSYVSKKFLCQKMQSYYTHTFLEIEIGLTRMAIFNQASTNTIHSFISIHFSGRFSSGESRGAAALGAFEIPRGPPPSFVQ